MIPVAPSIAILAIVFFVTFCVCMLDVNLGGMGSKTLFAWHPIFMAGGIVVMGLGATAYVADYGDVLNKLVGADRTARRNMHSIAGMLGAMAVLVGWLVAWVVHEYKGMSHVAAGAPVYVQARYVVSVLGGRAIHKGCGSVYA